MGGWHNLLMSDFEVVSDRSLDGPTVPVGLSEPRYHPQIQAPLWLERTVEYPSLGLLVTLRLEQRNGRFELLRLKIEGFSGKPVQTKDLTALALPEVIYKVCRDAIGEKSFWAKSEDSGLDGKAALTRDDEFLAQLYCLEYLCQGSPRNTFVNSLGIPRSTATLRIKELRRFYALPGKKDEK
jgi:hypothetical protein